MRRFGLLILIYYSIIMAIFQGFDLGIYTGYGILVSIFFFGFWILLSSSVFRNSKLLRWIGNIIYLVMAVNVLSILDDLIIGIKIALNRTFDIFNSTFHRNFAYFWNVSEKNAISYMVILLTLGLFFYSGLLILNRWYYKRVVLISMPMMAFLMVFAPKPIHGNILLYIGSIIAYYYLERFKPKFAGLTFVMLFVCCIFYTLYPSTEVFGEHMTSTRQGIIILTEYANKWVCGEQPELDLDFLHLSDQGLTSHNDEKNYIYLNKADNDVYIRVWTGAAYKKGNWVEDEKKDKISILNEEQGTGRYNYLQTLLGGRGELKKEYLRFEYADEEMKDHLIPYHTLYQDEEQNRIYYMAVKKYLSLLPENRADYRVNEDYLYVPKKIRRRIKKDLANEEVTSSSGQKEIVQYVLTQLKNNYTFVQDGVETPKGEDPIYYFLNSSKRGGAAEYVTSAAMMLRSYGIATRYVEGYHLTEDTYQKSSMSGGLVKVALTPKETEFWVEVYVNKFGWVPIDVLPNSISLVAASDARELVIPGIPKITISLSELFIWFLKFTAVAIAILLFRMLLHYIYYNHKKLYMTNNEIIQWYATVWEHYRDYTIPFFEVDHLIELARYSNHELDQYDVQVVLEAAQSARRDYRKQIPFYLALFDLFIMCRDIL